HGRHGRDEEQLDDAGLGQPDVAPDAAAPAGPASGVGRRAEGAGVGRAHRAPTRVVSPGPLLAGRAAGSPAGSRQARRAAVKRTAQMRAPVARWAVRVTGDSLVHTLPAPSRISTPMRAAAARTMSVTGAAGRRRRASAPRGANRPGPPPPPGR